MRQKLAAFLALLVAIAGLAVAVSSPASAAPGGSGDDGEGGSKSLVEQLEAASKGYLDAKDALARAQQRQRQLGDELKRLDAELGPQQAAFDDVAGQAYVTGRVGTLDALLSANSPTGFLDRAQALQSVAANQDATLRNLRTTKENQAKAKAAADQAVREATKQTAIMANKKAQAEAALKKANAGQDDPKPTDGGGSAKATPAKRDSDGSLPAEGCSVPDPTSSGCITPRLKHALQQAQSAGFTHYVHCFREQNSGEHPKGRACDFAADKDTFGGVATGANKEYGTRLANYFINNSDELGVLYVIWFKRIWLPSSGWKSYSGGNGDPSSDHTNHVHLSVR